MIFDTLKNRSQYFKSSVFDEIFDKLKIFTIDSENGNYYQGEGYYFKVMNYDTKNNPVVIESHKKEVDVQILLSGSENIKIYNKTQVKTISDYEEEIDCQFYESIESPDIELKLSPGNMVVFFPQDIHGCQYATNNKIENVKKIVIKIDEKLFT